jgi:DNA-directed RNA polymerase subunit RPC12/RpoP
MAKIPMTVVPKPEPHTRYVSARSGAGSKAWGPGQGDYSYVCGSCRDLILQSADPDKSVISLEDDEGNFIDVMRLREMVYKCKNCGAYNEIPQAHK